MTIAPLGLFSTSHSMSRARGHGAGGIVRIADIDQAGVRTGRGHGLHVVRVGLGERDADDFGADELGGALAGFIAGVGGDEGTVGTGEREHSLVQGRAGPGVGSDVTRTQAFHLRDGVAEAVGFAVEIAAAAVDDGVHRLAGFLARAERVLVRVDHDRVRRRGDLGKLGKRGLVVKRQGGAGGDDGGDAAEIPARKAAVEEVAFLFPGQNGLHRSPPSE